MLFVDQYKEWVLPSLLKFPVWGEYIDALLDEVITLQMYNMGSMNRVGFNLVPEVVGIEERGWILCGEYDSGTGVSFGESYFRIEDKDLVFDSGSVSPVSEAVFLYNFVLGRRYKVTFDVSDVGSGTALPLWVGVGRDKMAVVEISTDISVELELEATDYFLLFRVDNDSGSFFVNNLKVVGVLSPSDEKERVSVMKRIVGIDSASRDVLECMRDSKGFPAVPDLPEYLLRQIVRDHNRFVSYSGAELAGLMFFYFLGYEVTFAHLYANKQDYESKVYAYIEQKKDDIFETSEENRYAVVQASASASYSLTLEDGHQVVVGDFLARQETPGFNPIFVEVLKVDGVRIFLANRVTVLEGDYLDVYRKYSYAVNPNPEEYMKTSHIDVYFKKKYLQDVELSFSELEYFFVRYLPVNVVIRFFGYRQAPLEDEFVLLEPAFRVTPGIYEQLQLSEQSVVPEEDYAMVVWSPTPGSHIDVYGNAVNGYSLVIGYVDGSGMNVYLKVPLPEGGEGGEGGEGPEQED